MGDQSFNTIAQYYASVWGSLDFDAFKATISPNATIWFTYYNGMNEKLTVNEFHLRMRISHFDNTRVVFVDNLEIIRLSSKVFKVSENTDFDRLGNGETEAGEYEYTGSGELTVGENDLISNIRYIYSKCVKK